MEKIIKDFKGLCNFIAFLAVMQILDTLNAFNALQKMDITALTNLDYVSMGISATTALTIVKVATIVPMVLGILILFYLSIKGRKEANDPSPAKLHIILSVIAAVCYAINTIDTLVNLFKAPTDLVMSILGLIVSAATAALMFFYFQYARKIRTKE